MKHPTYRKYERGWRRYVVTPRYKRGRSEMGSAREFGSLAPSLCQEDNSVKLISQVIFWFFKKRMAQVIEIAAWIRSYKMKASHFTGP